MAVRAMDLTALVAVNFLRFFFLPDTSRFKHGPAEFKNSKMIYFDFCWAIHLSVRDSRRSSGRVPPLSISS
jgi:hypothetical protein